MYGIVASNEIFQDSNSIKDLILKNKMITMQHRKNKRGLQQLSDAQKMEAITKVQKGETKAAVAREFGVPESTLRGWCKKAKLNGHCQSALNKSLQVTSTMSPVLLTPEMAYRDCSYSKGSGSDEGSATHPFSDEQEDEDVKPSVVIPEEQRRVLDWLNYGHYPQLAVAAQTPPTKDNKPAQPVVTSSTCDNFVRSTLRAAKPYKKHHKAQNNVVHTKNVGFYNWCKSKKACDGSSSPVSPLSLTSSEKNDSYEDEPLALIVPSKRRFSDIEASLKTELNKMYHDGQTLLSKHNNAHHNLNNNNSYNKNNNVSSNTQNHMMINNNNNNYNNNNHNKNNINNNNDNNTVCNNDDTCNVISNDNKQTLSVEEALRHGEVFLDWLKACSDPNVTVFQAMQIGTLIRNLRSSLERNQSRR